MRDCENLHVHHRRIRNVLFERHRHVHVPQCKVRVIHRRARDSSHFTTSTMRSLISNSSNATSTVLTLACGPSLLITHTSLSSPSTPPVLINLPIPTMTPDSQPPSKTATVSVPQTHIDKAEHITSLTSTIHDTTLHVTCSIFKTVYTYTLPLPLSSKTLPPQPVTFTTPKRISTITLLPPTPAGAALTTTPLLLVSDKAGDVDCYTLTGDSSRHMYGHTASIITAAATFTSGDEVGVVTGDRDEKVSWGDGRVW